MNITIAAAAAVVGLMAVLAGAGAAWWLHRRTQLSARNLYLAWPLTVAAVAAAATTRQAMLIAVAAAVLVAATVAVVLGRRWRLAALGAGGELRQHEQQRLMVWRVRRGAGGGERVYIASQGELIRERAWPAHVPALPMTGDGRARVPLGAGMHLYFVGATGAGKTTSARRWLLARGLGATQTAILALDPKGDPELERDLRAIAAARGRPFVVFDPFDPATDRWNPIWADDPGAVVARLVAPVEADSDTSGNHPSRTRSGAGQPVILRGIGTLADGPWRTHVMTRTDAGGGACGRARSPRPVPARP